MDAEDLNGGVNDWMFDDGDKCYVCEKFDCVCPPEPPATETVRCPDHRNGGATRCPRGGPELQIWQRRQWGN